VARKRALLDTGTADELFNLGGVRFGIIRFGIIGNPHGNAHSTLGMDNGVLIVKGAALLE
jgi:hypothetical protein